MRLGKALRGYRLLRSPAFRDGGAGSLRAIAREIGIDAATLLRIENGKPCSGQNLAAILRWLLEEDDAEKLEATAEGGRRGQALPLHEEEAAPVVEAEVDRDIAVAIARSFGNAALRLSAIAKGVVEEMEAAEKAREKEKLDGATKSGPTD